MNESSQPQQRVLLYCRVSDPKQDRDGNGLQSQHHRMIQYCQQKGYLVEASYSDMLTGGGSFWKRSGIRQVLDHLDQYPEHSYVVLFDDLKRFARDLDFHRKLRRELSQRGARPECLNYTFDDSPEGQFVETILAAQAELERKQNARQTFQKMKAHMEAGYYMFNPPMGYAYKRVNGQKQMVPHPDNGKVVQEALRGLANGRFESFNHFARFLKRHGVAGARSNMLKKVLCRNLTLYTGDIEYPKWQISRRKGKHEPLISRDTARRLEQALNGRKRPVRNRNEAFPLRGIMQCESCGNTLGAYFSKGRSKHYPYYRCGRRKCTIEKKNFRLQDVEQAFERLMGGYSTDQHVVNLALDLTSVALTSREGMKHLMEKVSDQRMDHLLEKRTKLLDKIISSENTSVIQACENELEKLHAEVEIQRKTPAVKDSQIPFEQVCDKVRLLLCEPYKYWQQASLSTKKKLLLQLFPSGITYSSTAGVRTTEKPLVFREIGRLGEVNSTMVTRVGFSAPIFYRALILYCFAILD